MIKIMFYISTIMEFYCILTLWNCSAFTTDWLVIYCIRCFSTNVKALVNISQTVANNMRKARISGSIVNISSQASKAALAEHTVYCGTKAAVDAITRVMALELGPHNVIAII